MNDNQNRTIAITGSTGGLGKEICLKLAEMGASLIFINRNLKKSEELANHIRSIYPQTKIQIVTIDLENIENVKKGVKELEKLNFDTLVLNAGIYNVPLKKTSTGINNVFQVNFVSQYYLVKKLISKTDLKKVVAVGSIAYKNIKIDDNDIDYSTHKKQSKIYGNSKKFLMLSLMQLLKSNKNIEYSIAHPGITLTNMTSHYPKFINWFIKFGVKIVFPSPKKASLNITHAINNKCEYLTWIGPSAFDVWGKPKQKKLKHIYKNDCEKIFLQAEEIYKKVDL